MVDLRFYTSIDILVRDPALLPFGAIAMGQKNPIRSGGVPMGIGSTDLKLTGSAARKQALFVVTHMAGDSSLFSLRHFDADANPVSRSVAISE